MLTVGVAAIIAIVLVVVLNTVPVGNANAESTYGGHGPWTIALSADGRGYLLNTTTGEAWHLEGSVKTKVQERTLQPLQPVK
jgi:hypothetical protein